MVEEEISLVKAQVSDLEKVMEFEKIGKSKYFSPYETEKEVKEYLTNSNVFLVKLGKEFIGTASYQSEGDSAYLNGLIISPTQRGKGYATIALHLMLDKVKDFKRIYNRVHPQNTSALLTYLKEDFKIIAWEDNHYGDNEPRLVIEKIKE